MRTDYSRICLYQPPNQEPKQRSKHKQKTHLIAKIHNINSTAAFETVNKWNKPYHQPAEDLRTDSLTSPLNRYVPEGLESTYEKASFSQ